jgi:predicted small integral membrane protein
VAAAVLIALPMLLHYVSHPEHLNYPHRVVSVFSPKLESGQASVHLQRNVFLTLGMFHLRGDENWRHGFSGAPLLDPLTGILFVIGLVASLRVRAGPSGALTVAWMFAMLLPNLLSVEGVPHGLRSSGTIPAIALLAGIGMIAAEDAMARRFGRRVILAALVGLGCWTAHRYFVVWGGDPRVVEAHDGAYRAAARTLLAAPPGVGRFLLANGKGFSAYGQPAEVHPYLFEMRDAPPVVLGPQDGGRLIMNGRPAFVAMVRRDDRALDLIKQLNPGAPIRPVGGPGLSPESPVYRIN